MTLNLNFSPLLQIFLETSANDQMMHNYSNMIPALKGLTQSLYWAEFHPLVNFSSLVPVLTGLLEPN